MLENLSNIYQHVDIYKGYFSNIPNLNHCRVLENGRFLTGPDRQQTYWNQLTGLAEIGELRRVYAKRFRHTAAQPVRSAFINSMIKRRYFVENIYTG
jgi:hypothetical protein